MCVYVCVYTVAFVWRLEDSLWEEFVFSIHNIDLRDQSQVVMLGSKFSSLLSILPAPNYLSYEGNSLKNSEGQVSEKP